MKRVGALVGAVVMVVAALAFRGSFDGDDGGSATDGDLGLVCPVEFAEICATAGEHRTETAGVTADELIAAADAEALAGDAWIVPAAWARLVIDERARLGQTPAFDVAAGALASSPVVLVAWTTRADELGAICGTPIDWTCLAEQDGNTLSSGDRVQTGSPRVDSATGLSVAAAQSANLLRRSDFAANDFTGSFESMASRLAAGQTDDPVGTMRLQGPGRLTAAGDVAAAATNLATNFGTLSPAADVEPTVRVDVVALVPTGASLDSDARDALTTTFRAAGWGAAGTGPDGLPPGGVLAAVRTLWNENR